LQPVARVFVLPAGGALAVAAAVLARAERAEEGTGDGDAGDGGLESDDAEGGP
jgi:hypothetical protein